MKQYKLQCKLKEGSNSVTMYEPYNRTTGRQILRQTLTWTDGQKKDRHTESQRNQEPDRQMDRQNKTQTY